MPKELVSWRIGPARGQSPRAIKGPLSAGYPPGRLRYYRGGMRRNAVLAALGFGDSGAGRLIMVPWSTISELHRGHVE